MRLKVKVIPCAKKNQVKEFSSGYKVYLTATPLNGKANRMLIDVLSEYLNVKRSRLKIVKGEKSRQKEVLLL